MKKKIYPFKVIKSSFRAKLVAIIVSITIIPLGALGIISYENYSSTISKITTQSVIQIAEQLNKNIETMIGDTEKLLEIADSNNVMSFLKYKHDTYDEAKTILGLFKIYRNSYKFNPSIKGIYIIGLNGKCISENNGVYYLNRDRLNKSNTFYEIINNQQGASIISSHIPNYTESTEKEMVISIGQAVREKVTHEIIGAIIIDLDISIIKDLCNSAKIGDTGFFFILDRNRDPVVYPGHDFDKIKNDYDWSKILQKDGGSNIEEINGYDTLIVNSVFSGTEWEIIGQVPMKEIMKDAYRLKDITIFILGLCIMFTFIILLFISDSLTRPIRKLRKSMKLVEMGNMHVKVECKGSDEIAELSMGFNRMIVEIRQLLEDSIREHENLKKSELKVLQSQINPHFLYNTLDAILWLADAGENHKVIQLVSALSKFFRIALSKGRDFIKAGDEVEHSRSYLTIQKIRYEDVLDFSIQVEDEVLGHMVLKLILQPIVENAIYHGIKNKRGGGMVVLKGHIEGNNIVFEIRDDGIGIKEDKLARIQARLCGDNGAHAASKVKTISTSIAMPTATSKAKDIDIALDSAADLVAASAITATTAPDTTVTTTAVTATTIASPNASQSVPFTAKPNTNGTMEEGEGEGQDDNKTLNINESANDEGADADVDADTDVDEDDNRGFGLYNVDRRIRLFYGQEYGLQISSEYGQGTCVSVTIPKRGELDV